MAITGFLCLLVACLFAGFSIAPLFNRLLPPERKQSMNGCMWIFAAMVVAWIGLACLFSVPAQDPNNPGYDATAMNSWDEPGGNDG